MSANESFFVRPKAAAAVKHGILSVYPPLFAAKAGSIVEGGRVVFLDGYAGQGRYDDGTSGSPLLFVRAARANPQRAVTGIFVERDPQRFASLCQVLDRADPDGSVRRIVREGDLGVLLPELLPAAGGAALFAFLDPFGTALDVGQLRAGLLRRPGRAPTEVLLHFSVLTIARMGGLLNTSHSRGGLSIPERKTVARADAFLGGDWWHSEFDALRSLVPPARPDGLMSDLDESVLLTATDVAMRVARRFCDGLGRQTGYRTVAMPVRPERGRAPKYILALFTKNDHGVWYFADTLGRAGRNWQQALHDDQVRVSAEKLAARLGEDLGLFELADLVAAPPPPFDFTDYERENRDQWVGTIAGNLHRLLAARGSGLRLVDHIDSVYGEVLGQAWERHVRAAVKRLHKSGLVLDDGTHEFWRRPIAVKIPHHRPPPPGDTAAPAERVAGEEAV